MAKTAEPPVKPSAPVPPNLQLPQQANHFELQRGSKTITYDPSSITGKPLLVYNDGSTTRSFTGDQITAVPTTIGTLLTVRIAFLPDVSVTDLSVLLPQVNLVNDKPERFKAIVLETRIATPFGGPLLQRGPVQTSTARTYRGKASFVMS